MAVPAKGLLTVGSKTSANPSLQQHDSALIWRNHAAIGLLPEAKPAPLQTCLSNGRLTADPALEAPISTDSVLTAHVDRAFQRASSLVNASFGFRILCNHPSASPQLLERLRTVPFLAASQEGDFVVISVDHLRCDGIGALQAIRSVLLDEPVRRCTIVRGTAPAPTGVRRRTAKRSTSVRITLLRGADEPYRSCLYRLRDERRNPDATLTERLVIAVHELALAGSSRKGSCSAVVVPISPFLWSPERPANNLSTGFLSIATSADQGRDELVKRVTSEFDVASANRMGLLQRAARGGRLPAVLWRPLTIGVRLFGAPAETAIVSNLGRISDRELSAFADDWHFVPSVRDRRSLSVGVIGTDAGLYASVSGHGEASFLDALGDKLWQKVECKVLDKFARAWPQ